MNSKSIKFAIFNILVLFILALTPLVWLPEGHILTGHDSGYPINVLEAYKNRFFSWNSTENLGIDNTTSLSTIPVMSIGAAVSFLGASVATAEKITFVFWFFAMLLSMWFFARSLSDRIEYLWFPLLSAILYGMNFYLLALWRYAAGTTYSAYTALPLVMMIYLKALGDNSKEFLRPALGIAFVISIFNGGGSLSLPLFGGLLVSFFWASLYYVITEESHRRKQLLHKLYKLIIVAGSVSILLNAYWFVPFVYYAAINYAQTIANQGGKAVVVVWTQSVSIFTSIANLFRLQGFPEWYENPSHPFANRYLTNPLLIAISMSFAPLAYASLLIAKKKQLARLILFFVVLSLLGIFFSAGVHPPTGWLYRLFMLYVPGFVIFRSAQYKFIPALYFAFAILISYVVNAGIAYIGKAKLFSKIPPVILPGILALSVAFGVVAYHYPYFQRGFFFYTKNLSTLLEVPSYVTSFDRWRDSNADDDGRMLILPRYNSVWKAGLYNWNYFSLYSVFNLIKTKPFVQYSYYLNESQLSLFNRLAHELPKQTALSKKLLNLFQIRYVMITGDVSYLSEDMPGESPEIYSTPLSQQNAYPLLWQEGPWQLRDNPSFSKRRIYSVSSLTELNGNGSDAPAAILIGADTFVLRQMLGKSVQNPLDKLPVNNAIHALPCSTCSLYTEEANILPQYTNILPGSLFYTIKKWRERDVLPEEASDYSTVSHELGLTLKRLAELRGSIDANLSETIVLDLIGDIEKSWSKVGARLHFEDSAAENYEAIARVSSFAKSEYQYLSKIISANSRYLDRLIGLQNTFKAFSKRISEYKRTVANKSLYTVTRDVKRGEAYLDAGTLGVTSDGSMIVPASIAINGKVIAHKPAVTEGKVDLGSGSFFKGDIITLTYPDKASLLGDVYRQSVTVDNRLQSCQIAQINAYDWEKKYHLVLQRAAEWSQTAQLYLRRRVNSQTAFSIEDSIIKPHFSFNFDRSVSFDQDAYFAGTDGDVGAYLYLCVTKGEQEVPMKNVIAAYEMVRPPLYIYDKQSAEAMIQPLSFRRINQTKYEVDVSKASFPMVLVFDENYNPLWRLSTVDGSSSIGALITRWRVPSLAEKTHTQVNGYANAWYLPEKPSDTIILEFYPQVLFYKGIIITAVAFIVAGILFMLRRNRS